MRYISPALRQDYETPLLPSGLLWTFTFYTNYSDAYYIGLDSIELFDSRGQKIDVLTQATVASMPPSISELGLTDPSDDRSCRNLFTSAGQKMWLSPLSRNTTEEERKLCVRRLQALRSEQVDKGNYVLPKQNMLVIMFDFPVAVSFIRSACKNLKNRALCIILMCMSRCFRFRNYSRTPTRGVRDIGISVDGTLVYMGALSQATTESQPMTALAEDTIGNSVVFTNDAAILRSERGRVGYGGGSDQDVLCIDERQVKVRSKTMYDKPQPTSEGVQTDITLRPQTMMSHS